MTTQTTIYATSSGSPSRGPCWHVTDGHMTHYRGYDLDDAIRIYERVSGQVVGAAERLQLASEADEISRASR